MKKTVNTVKTVVKTASRRVKTVKTVLPKKKKTSFFFRGTKVFTVFTRRLTVFTPVFTPVFTVFTVFTRRLAVA